MEVTKLKQVFLYRYLIGKECPHYSEVETNVMIGIYLMNKKYERCSCNTLFEYLSKVHRTPYRKTLLSTIRKFKEDGVIRINGSGINKSLKLNAIGQLYLIELEKKLKGLKFS